MDPGVIALAQVIVDHTAPAEVDYAGQLSMTSGVALVARVSADQAVTTTVQLDLQRTDGTSVGSVFATARLPAGGGTVPVPVPGGEATTLALSGGLVVSRAALAVGGACSDVTLVAVPVRP
jgi:hypothetical protein